MKNFTFRLIKRSDFTLLGRWLATPHVSRRWADDPAAQAIEASYGGCVDGTEPSQVFIARHDGVPVGLIQRYRIDAYPDYLEELAPILAVPVAASSIDYFLGPVEALGKGWGTEMIQAFVARIWRDDAEASCIIVPTNALNRTSWRSLELVVRFTKSNTK